MRAMTALLITLPTTTTSTSPQHLLLFLFQFLCSMSTFFAFQIDVVTMKVGITQSRRRVEAKGGEGEKLGESGSRSDLSP